MTPNPNAYITSQYNFHRAARTRQPLRLVARKQHAPEFRQPEKNHFLEIKEFANTSLKLDRKSFHIGGPNSASTSAPTSN
jgi:hypothetical protein